MNPNELVESKWMVAEEFGLNGIPREPCVTIKDVRKQKIGSKESWGVLIFAEEWAKPLKVNTTSKRALMLMFSETDTNLWLGKRINLYPRPGHYPKGKKLAVRIKGSPDIKAPISFSVQAFGGGEDVYNLLPTGGAKAAAPATPYDAMWKLWRDAGNGKDSSAEFLALIKKAIGKTTKQLVAADVPTFEAALAPPSDGPPPIDDEEAAIIAERERAMAEENGVPS